MRGINTQTRKIRERVFEEVARAAVETVAENFSDGALPWACPCVR